MIIDSISPGDVIAIVAIVVSCVLSITAMIVSYRSNKLLNSLSIAKLKKEINRLESADIRVAFLYKKYYLSNSSTNTIIKFQIKNVGNSPAINLNILDDELLKCIERFWKNNSIAPKPSFPIPILKHACTYEFSILPNKIAFMNRYMHIEWDDINGNHIKDNAYIEITQLDVVVS